MSFDYDRAAMVDRLVSAGYARTGRVIEALRKVQRHLFVPDEFKSSSYVDSPQPIGFNQTISAPHMVAMMSELLDVEPGLKVLEVGTGSGYQAAVLSVLSEPGRVVSVERVGELAGRTRRLLESLGYSNVSVVEGDGTIGYEADAPYDRIIVTAAAPEVPMALISQLASGGRMIVPVGSRLSQTLVEIMKDERGEVTGRSHGGVVFVPLIGRHGWAD